jgi:hypothetical protein
MAVRIAGIAQVSVTGGANSAGGANILALRGNFTVSPTSVERTMLAGQDGIHGYQELPRVPYIEGDISTVPTLNIADLQAQTNVTVTAFLANGKQYTLSQAVCKAGLEINTRDGQTRVRWEGITCQESNFSGALTVPGLGA